PIRPALDHAGDAVLALRGNPAGHLDRRQRPMAQRVATTLDVLVHGDEPLRRVAEDHRLLRAPRMRILMFEATARDQHAARGQGFDYPLFDLRLLAGFGQNPLCGKTWRLLGEAAVGVDSVRYVRIDTGRGKLGRIGGPNIKVVATVPRRGMDKPGAGVFGDVIAGKKRYCKVVAAEFFEWMIAKQARQSFGGHRGQLLECRDPGLAKDVDRQPFGEAKAIPHFGPVVRWRIHHLIKTIFYFGRVTDRAISEDRPRRGGPDQD